MLLGHYRAALRADFQSEYGIDIASLFAQRRYVYLLDLIDGLPTNSRLAAAMLNDPEFAEEMAKQQLERDDEKQDPWTPAFESFGMGEQLLAQIFDGIQALQATQVAAAGGKPGKPTPFPRPVTEVEKAKRRLQDNSARDLMNAFGITLNNYN